MDMLGVEACLELNVECLNEGMQQFALLPVVSGEGPTGDQQSCVDHKEQHLALYIVSIVIGVLQLLVIVDVILRIRRMELERDSLLPERMSPATMAPSEADGMAQIQAPSTGPSTSRPPRNRLGRTSAPGGSSSSSLPSTFQSCTTSSAPGTAQGEIV